jgi:hypothetical protein
MARFQIRMRPRRPAKDADEVTAQLFARIEDLELRIKLLEARVRAVSAENKAYRESSGVRAAAAASRKARRSRPRPRCPGCVLELPPGKRGDSCVWCGFRFDSQATK